MSNSGIREINFTSFEWQSDNGVYYGPYYIGFLSDGIGLVNYNEDNIEEAQEMARREGVTFMLLQSSRWNSENDPLRPSKKYNMSRK